MEFEESHCLFSTIANNQTKHIILSLVGSVHFFPKEFEMATHFKVLRHNKKRSCSFKLFSLIKLKTPKKQTIDQLAKYYLIVFISQHDQEELYFSFF